MTDETKLWLDVYPETDHPLDTKRWYDAVHNALRTGIDLDFIEIRDYIIENKKWNVESVDEFIEKKKNEYSHLKHFFSYINRNKIFIV